MDFHSGFVSLLAPPNAGKSTLLNAIVGQKIAITSPKPNTTRTRVTGVCTDERGQIVFLDTPGIFHRPTGFNTRLVAHALDTIGDVDAGVLLQDCTRAWDSILSATAATLTERGAGCIVGITKIDLLKRKEDILPLIETVHAETQVEHVIPLSVPRREGLDDLLDCLYAMLPEGPAYFEKDTVTDQPERAIVSEIIRESVFHLTQQEIPYASTVEVEEFREPSGVRGKERIYIRACIYVEKESQKGIVIGKRGSLLKKIGTAARTRIERFLAAPVFLELVVRVAPNWRRDEAFLKRMGY